MSEDEEEARKSKQSELSCTAPVKWELDPEIGPVGVLGEFQKNLARLLHTQLVKVIECILQGVQNGNLQSAKMLVDLIQMLEKKLFVPERMYQSLAEVLWKEYQEQLGTKGLTD